MVGGQKTFAFVEVALTRVGVGLISESTFSGVASVTRPIPLIFWGGMVARSSPHTSGERSFAL